MSRRYRDTLFPAAFSTEWTVSLIMMVASLTGLPAAHANLRALLDG